MAEEELDLEDNILEDDDPELDDVDGFQDEQGGFFTNRRNIIVMAVLGAVLLIGIVLFAMRIGDDSDSGTYANK